MNLRDSGLGQTAHELLDRAMRAVRRVDLDVARAIGFARETLTYGLAGGRRLAPNLALPAADGDREPGYLRGLFGRNGLGLGLGLRRDGRAGRRFAAYAEAGQTIEQVCDQQGQGGHCGRENRHAPAGSLFRHAGTIAHDPTRRKP